MTHARSYEPTKDFECGRNFLIRLFERTGSFANWMPQRFENSHIHEKAHIRIWEDLDDNQQMCLRGMVTREGNNHYFLHVDPDFPQLLEEMVEWVEDHHANEESEVLFHVLQDDIQREQVLHQKGYARRKVYGWIRVYDPTFIQPQTALPDGYTIRPLNEHEHPEYATAIREVFGHSFFTEETVKSIQSGSYYVPELDLVVADSNDEIACFLTFRIDPVSNFVELEPLGTRTGYRKQGLATILIAEGIQRLIKYNPRLIYIGGAADTPAANAVYEKTGFTTKIAEWIWA